MKQQNLSQKLLQNLLIVRRALGHSRSSRSARSAGGSLIFLAIPFSALAALGYLSLSPSATVSAASPNDVIINEIMYNPNTGNQNDEFLELYNTTGSNIDLGGWSFSAGVTLTGGGSFTGGTIIPANGYLVVSPNIAQTLATYGVAASAEYAPSNLSNGGETVTLIDDSANVISSVSYDDVSPWPTSPDGTGPSLELKGTGLDNTDPANWGASTANGGTPLAVNSQVGLNLPIVTGVNDPNGISASDPVDIVATVTGVGITSVELKYKLNFDADLTLTMYDDGAHNDGGAGDDVYGAQIPGQAIKTLVRFKVEATNGSGTQGSPSIDDSMDYHGYYVKDPSVTSNAPILEWFISDADYTDMHTNHVFDDVYVPCVIVYGDDVYDNSLVRIKGELSRTYSKHSYKVKLPSGYKVDLSGGSSREITEFHLNGWFAVGTIAHELGAWWAIEQSGLEHPDNLPARLQKNGEFYGLYVYAEKYQSEWRQDYGYNNGAMYEDFIEVHSGAADLTDMNAIFADLTLDRKDSQLRENILDKVDIPRLTNFQSNASILSTWDHSTANNNFYFKSNETERWSMLFWDVTSSFSSDPQGFHFPSPYDHYNPTSAYDTTHKFIQDPMWDQSDLRGLILRRVRTLTDKLYSSDTLLQHMQAIDTLHSSDISQDLAKWPSDASSAFVPRSSMTEVQNWLLGIKTHLTRLYRAAWAIPAAQTQPERESVSFDEVVADSNNANEYIKLSNSANTAVDLSDWLIEGINYTIPAGAVIPANGSIYILRDDIGYKAGHSPVLVAGQYSNDLGSNGTLTLKTDTGDTIDTRNY